LLFINDITCPPLYVFPQIDKYGTVVGLLAGPKRRQALGGVRLKATLEGTVQEAVGCLLLGDCAAGFLGRLQEAFATAVAWKKLFLTLANGALRRTTGG